MILNKNSVRKEPPALESGLYSDVEERDIQIKSDVLDVDGNPTGVTNITTMTKLVPRKLEKDLTIRASDLDIQNLVDAGVDPSTIGKPQSFFIHKDSSSMIHDIEKALLNKRTELFEPNKRSELFEPNKKNDEVDPSPDKVINTIVEPDKQD